MLVPALCALMTACRNPHNITPAETGGRGPGGGRIAMVGWVQKPGYLRYEDAASASVASLLSGAGGLQLPEGCDRPLVILNPSGLGDATRLVVRSNEWSRPLREIGVDIRKFETLDVKAVCF